MPSAVPVTLKGKTEGMLAVGFPADKSPDENTTIKFLKVIAAMIAQAMRVEQTVNEESRKLAEENVHLKQELKEKYEFGHLIGNSSPMRQVYDQVSQVARSNATVLLRGESGTGKELIANAIHYNSLRSKRPFIKVNCAALPENLIESELFGYEKGAFTGASTLKKGRFELADGGTIYVNLALSRPEEFCQNNPAMVVSRFASGAQNGVYGTNAVLRDFAYNSGTAYSDPTVANYDSPATGSLTTTASTVGTTSIT